MHFSGSFYAYESVLRGVFRQHRDGVSFFRTKRGIAMWQLLVSVAHFLSEVVLALSVALGFVCWVWFVIGLLYYNNHKDLPDVHVDAEAHQGMTWYNAWRWSVSENFRPLSEYVIAESSIFGVVSALAFIWVFDLMLR
jgi:hypothetical protein